MTTAASAEIEKFVRGTLGCRCPDEVFRSTSIERSSPTASAPGVLQLSLGGRLLIRVVAVPSETAAADWIEQLVAAGVGARDRDGYNRFRLVIAAPATVVVPGDIAARFARATHGDDRAHLHLLSVDELPRALRPPEMPALASLQTTPTD